ncbi:hypothetical protein RZS08_05885 [Arthrospira platensis SPKY1]|nr:hypothetical protein [Arthrospira platensis SPKY1]
MNQSDQVHLRHQDSLLRPVSRPRRPGVLFAAAGLQTAPPWLILHESLPLSGKSGSSDAKSIRNPQSAIFEGDTMRGAHQQTNENGTLIFLIALIGPIFLSGKSG